MGLQISLNSIELASPLSEKNGNTEVEAVPDLPIGSIG